MELRLVEVLVEKTSSYVMDGKPIVNPIKYAKGYFHCWEQYRNGEDYSRVYAIVELEDGNINRYEISELRFVDKHTNDFALPLSGGN